jgi:hypothetical protein
MCRTPRVAASAVVLLHRFYAFQSLKYFDRLVCRAFQWRRPFLSFFTYVFRQTVAECCLSLAAKADINPPPMLTKGYNLFATSRQVCVGDAHSVCWLTGL